MSFQRTIRLALIMGTFLHLLLRPYPEEDDALVALEAAHTTCVKAGIAVAIAWRDSVALQEWRKRAGPEEMVSDAEIHAAHVWDRALLAARAALRLPLAVKMDIHVVSSDPNELTLSHGPDRIVWRRGWLERNGL